MTSPLVVIGFVIPLLEPGGFTYCQFVPSSVKTAIRPALRSPLAKAVEPVFLIAVALPPFTESVDAPVLELAILTTAMLPATIVGAGDNVTA